MWNESACYEDLKGAGAAPTTKPELAGRGLVLLLDILRAGEGVFLAVFLVFPKQLATLPLQQPPAFWERSLWAGSNYCLCKAVLLCGGVVIIPHLAFLMKVLVRVVLGCKDVHKAEFPCLCLHWSLAPVWDVCSWFSGGIIRDLLFETGDRLAFCLAAPLETINRPAEEQVQWFCVPECCSAVLRVVLGTSSVKGACWEKVALAGSFELGHHGGFVSWWSHHSHPQSFSWAAWRAVLGRPRGSGELKGAALPKDCHCVAMLSRAGGCSAPCLPAWVVRNQQHCERKHTHELMKNYFRDFLLFKELSLSTEFADWPVFSSRFWGVLCRRVLVCVAASPIPCCGITPALLLWNILVRCHIKGMNIHL